MMQPMADGYAGVRNRRNVGGAQQPEMFDTPLASGDGFFPDSDPGGPYSGAPALPANRNIVHDHVQIAVHAVDRIVPSDEQLAERGGRIGAALARHRRRLVCLLVALFIAAAFLCIGLFAYWLVRALHVRAPGVEMNQVDDAGGVRLPNGIRVLNVVEPVRPMWTVEQAVLLLDDREALAKYTPLTRERLAHGYLSWHVAHERPRANFTLHGWHRAAEQYAHGDEKSTCLCMASFGLPYNAVYVSARNATLYEPRIVQSFDSGRHVMVRTACVASDLLAQARGKDTADDRPEKMRMPASGIVAYLGVTDDGSVHGARNTFDVPDFPCIQHCVSLFNDELLAA